MYAFFKWLIIALAVLALSLAGGTWFGQRSFDQQAEQMLARLEAWKAPAASSMPLAQRMAKAPAVVRAYLKRAIPAGAALPRIAQVEQQGWFRPSPAWPRLTLTARQAYRVDAPGMVWAAELKLFPLVWLSMIDSYIGGNAFLRGKALGLVGILGQTGKPAKHRILLRYLAESPLFPVALVPGPHLAWEPAGPSAARATLSLQGMKASGVFYFNDQGDPHLFVTKQRTRDLGQGRRVRQTWTVVYSRFQDVGGWRLPGRARAAWRPPEGAFVYADFTISKVTLR